MINSNTFYHMSRRTSCKKREKEIDESDDDINKIYAQRIET